jgi:hypothetical protein
MNGTPSGYSLNFSAFRTYSMRTTDGWKESRKDGRGRTGEKTF